MLVSDQVTACDALAEILISPVVTTCGTTVPVYSIVSVKNVKPNPLITSTKITFIPENNNYETGEIIYKVSCGRLSSIGKILIVYKNNCITTNCTQYQICNKCTGLCENIPNEIGLKTKPLNEIKLK